MRMETLFWAITFCAICGAGVYSGMRVKSQAGWQTGGGQMSWLSVAVIMGAFQIGGVSIIGCAQDGFNMGLSGAWYTLIGCLYYLYAAFIWAGAFRKNISTGSVPDFLKSKYDSKTALVYSYINVINGIIYVPLQLFTMSTVIQMAIPGFSFWGSIIVGLGLAALYTAVGGIHAAKVVGRATCFSLYFAVIVACYLIVDRVGGWEALNAALPPTYFSMANVSGTEIFGWIVAGFFSSAIAQTTVQPMIAARSLKDARIGAIVGAVIAGPIGIFTAIIGMAGKAQGLTDNAALAFSTTVSTYIHPVFAGIIFGIASLIVATTMSSKMLATSTIMTSIYKIQIKPGCTDSQALKFSRIFTVIYAFVCLIPIALIQKSTLSNLLMYLTMLTGVPMFFPVIAGMFWKKVTKQGAFWAMISGFAIGLVATLTPAMTKVIPSGIYIVACGTFVGVAVSLATQPKEAAN